ncbi:DEKNAAC104007 [Brettanomyces naardenensis]|uniref:DEKNAAC104007 n=1 Tax=Brettanomyces naardenensis TaxID=13370 RepID=A0A448YQN7_BRENA|nr:DEKNAAC104007 [Brettanomyces naardenensis]
MFEESESNSESELEDEETAERRQLEDEEKAESAADKRRRLAKEYLSGLGGSAEGEGEGDYAFDAKQLDEEIIGSRLQRDVAEEKGYVYKFIGGRMNLKDAKISVRRVGNLGMTCIAVSYPYLYSTSKDMELAKWDIKEAGKKAKKVKYVRGGDRYKEISKDQSENGHCDEIYTCAASPDGRYVVSGGRDKRVIIWSGENLACQRVLPTSSRHGEVYGMAFRRKTDQLYVGCGDLKIRTYSVDQQAELETLYGHQDSVVDVSALGLERCVSVGSRDRSVMLWKIGEESRLTFRGGDSIEKYQQLVARGARAEADESVKKEEGKEDSANAATSPSPALFIVEGSIDCVSMIDDSHFVTGSDNGNIALWSISKKKPIFTVRQAHGFQPKLLPSQSSVEKDVQRASAQVPEQQPYWITSIHAIPYSDTFITGSWNGTLKVWKLREDLRSFESIGELDRAKGVVTKIDSYEEEGMLRVYASLSKEHRLGRWIKVNGGRNGIYSAVIELK